MKRNYNDAYEYLIQAGIEAKKYLSPNILSVIDDSKLNQKALESLDLALNTIGQNTTSKKSWKCQG